MERELINKKGRESKGRKKIVGSLRLNIIKGTKTPLATSSQGH